MYWKVWRDLFEHGPRQRLPRRCVGHIKKFGYSCSCWVVKYLVVKEVFSVAPIVVAGRTLG